MPLAGFETDINRLIDSYALQAHNEQEVCFATFKRLFRLGSFAYLHQAYPGLEHNPDYTQLLFAAALDRLDTLSPTAPASSPLWALYSRQQQQAPQQQQDAPPQQQLDGQAAAAATGQPQPATAADGQAQVGWTQQQQQQQPLQANGCVPPDEQQALLQQQQQQPASPGLGWLQQEGDQLMLDQLHSPCATPPPQQQQPSPGAGTHADPQQQADGSGSAQLQPQPQPGLPAAAPPPDEATPHLLLDLEFEELDLLGPAGLASPRPLPAASPLLQSHPPHQQQQQQPLSPLQLSAGPACGFAGGNDGSCDDDGDGFFEDLLAILDEATAPLDAGPAAAAAGSCNPGLLAEQQKLQQQRPGATSSSQAEAEVAGTPVLDRPQQPAAAGSEQPLVQQQQQQAAFAGSLLDLPVPGVHPHQQQQQQQLVAVPLVVKAAVVFTLLCLHETQLNLPKVAAYVPLRQLQLLAVAAGEFRAAGPAAGGDPLRALQAMLSGQQLLVGGFKRRSTWAPTPPAWLLPGPRVSAAEAAREAAIRAAAARAAARSSGSGVRTAAVAAAVAAARSLGMTAASAVEPLVHREAVFHIKTALRSLSNFRHLQRLCGEYGSARRAMFEPLLGLQEPPLPAAAGAAETSGEVAPAAAAAAGQPAPRKGRRRQQQGQATATESAAATQPAAAPQPPPELFECSFGSALQQLAADEAARMLMLLDPSHNPNQVKKTLAQLQKADKAAAAKTAANAAADQPAAGTNGGRKRQRGLAAARAAAAAAVPARVASYVGEVAAAGILGPGEWEELQQLSGPQNEAAGVSGAVRQVLQAQRERQQHTLRVAEGWLSAHDAMMDQADGEDMP